MEAIILVGGLGTRLRKVVADVPKPMAKVSGVPFLEYLLDYLLEQGIERVVLAVGYKKECIKKYFGYIYKKMEIIYSEEEEPLGTGGAIQKAIQICKDKKILVLNGDTYLEFDLDKMRMFHIEQGADITIAQKFMNDCSRYGAIEVQGNRVKKFIEKGIQRKGTINAGIYLINKNIFLNTQLPVRFSFEKDFLEKKVLDLKIVAYEAEGYFIDIGIPEDYQEAQRKFKK